MLLIQHAHAHVHTYMYNANTRGPFVKLEHQFHSHPIPQLLKDYIRFAEELGKRSEGFVWCDVFLTVFTLLCRWQLGCWI